MATLPSTCSSFCSKSDEGVRIRAPDRQPPPHYKFIPNDYLLLQMTRLIASAACAPRVRVLRMSETETESSLLSRMTRLLERSGAYLPPGGGRGRRF
ncbi:hypothetical protein TNIN_217841 [Trichonephila inaurata madagascariensis]|uniref:Uncharacterized protein n=1 Tax=Trichonephila inaurata madagascariensis TaxID=2747483 RepID=A0A8X6WWT5_9ARAC|nr:hypothetical protein TNIN_217841 [Trichonephila inaurata madagascariensis]